MDFYGSSTILAAGGHKSDFDGHSKHSYNNYMIYPYVYGPYCAAIFTMPEPTPNGEFDEGYWNNTCVLATAADYYFTIQSCNTSLVCINDFCVLGDSLHLAAH